MSGVIGEIPHGRSGVIQDLGPRDKPWKFIHQDTFVFQYGSGTWTTNYTLPQNISNSSGIDSDKYYWARTNSSDGRWSSDMIVMGSPTNNFYHNRVGGYWNYLQVTTGGLIQVLNQNGGSSGNITAELRVWLMESFEYTDWNNGS